MKTKKELKDAYRQKKPTMGVFQIKNVINGKILIDSSTDIDSRMNRHRMELKFGTHQNKLLLNDWKEFGEENFIFKTLSEIKHKDDADIDYKKELKLLQEMITEELQIPENKKY
jgi:ribosomal protein S18